VGRVIEIILKVFGFILDPLFKLVIRGHRKYKFVDGNDGTVFLTNSYSEAVGMLERAGRGIIYDNMNGEVIVSR
jgi:hypothetical protein